MKNILKIALFSASLSISALTHAAATDDLGRFLKSVTSAQGTFEQKVFTRAKGKIKTLRGRGHSLFSVPGNSAGTTALPLKS